MFKKILLMMVLVFSIFPFDPPAFAEHSLNAAFIRNDDLWIKIGDKEKRITKGEYVRHPKWSHDGGWIAYLKGRDSRYSGELWLYNLIMNKHFKIKSDITRGFQWSPRENRIGFLMGKDLYVLKTEAPFLAVHIAGSIENFSWLPDGKGLLVSSKESAKLNSDIILSTISLVSGGKPVLKHFYTVPVGENEIYVSTSPFKWSHHNRWISFLLVPTASMAADSNTLCLLSSNGQVFERVDEMLGYEDWFQWSPTKSVLGYINGVGREAQKNKQLKTVSVPPFFRKVFTPAGFADRDLAWKNGSVFYVSRSKESELVDISERPMPSIYQISNGQTQITFPAKHEGDFAPQFVNHQLCWVRTDMATASVWVSRPDGKKESRWIKNVTVASSYYERWNWDEVFSLYEGEGFRK